MTCKCIEEMTPMLAEKNTRFVEAIVFAKPAYTSLTIATERIERRRDGKSAVVVFPTFCPFCGTKYDAEPEQVLTHKDD